MRLYTPTYARVGVLVVKALGERDMLENKIEKRLVRKVKKELKGLCYKFTSPGNAGVPDRIILVDGGKIYFAETKAPGKDLKPHQKRQKDKFENLGSKVFVIDNIDAVDSFIEKIKKEIGGN